VFESWPYHLISIYPDQSTGEGVAQRVHTAESAEILRVNFCFEATSARRRGRLWPLAAGKDPDKC
jgi:hypothetical protein